jgi:CRP-like cAMP-binding protein
VPQIDRSLVAKSPFFVGFTPEETDEILSLARSQHYPKGSAVFSQGEPAHSFFVVLNGHIQVVKTTPDGQQVIMRYIQAGGLIGIGVVAGFDAYPATALCVVDSVVARWPSSSWPQLIEKYPKLATNALKTMGGRVEESLARVVEISTQETEQRIAHAVLRLAEQSGRRAEGEVEIDFPLSRQDIASITGTSLFTVSRILSAWEQRGIIRSGRQRVFLKQPDKLLEIAETERE